jgi:hypothetical protein
MTGFLAYIMPVQGGPVDPGFGVPGWPAHPIAPGGRPPSISGGPGSLPPWVMPPIAPGGPPPGIWPSPGHPAHPIAPGGAPPGIWGGTPPNYVDIGGPGPQPHPEHPIVLPPGTPKPPLGIWSEPIIPPGIWGGPPLQIWGDPILPAEPPKIIDWHAAWTPSTGWIVVGIPNVPAPTPSQSPQQSVAR